METSLRLKNYLILDEHELSQVVQEPTRRQGNSQSLLDLVLTNNTESIRKVKVVPVINDHDISFFNLKVYCQRKRPVKRKIYIRKKADHDKIKQVLNKFSEYYVNSLKDEPIDVKWDEFETTVKHIMNTCIPNKLTSSRYNLPWFNRPLRRLSRAKQRAYNKAKKSGKDSDWSKYRNMKKSMRNQLKSARDTYISDYLGDAIKENPKRFWLFIKQLNQDDPGVADLEVNNEIIHEAQRKSEILNNYFSSVYTDGNINEIPDVGENPTPGINPLIITVQGVLKQLDSLKPNKAGGPDEIPAWFLKEYSIEIAPVLTNIFRSSIESGIVPNKWKKANVCAILKKGKNSDPSNYRPISLTCISSKLVEHIIHSHMMKHFENYRVLNDSQHGFRAKRSTETQLILTIHDIASSIQQNQSIHAIVLDFTKAFDKVTHQRLLKKMEYYGIRGPLLNWFTSFLFERQQTVICEGRSSTSASVSSGVPQGTVLAPLLFLLYINDLPDSINSTVRLFADDALLYGVISNDADGEQIQNDLIRLEQWQTIWQMNFNPAKC